MILTGFLAFLDPPKDDVKDVLKKLKQDGITVKILTGDNAAVTKSVASRVGLNTKYIYSEKTLLVRATMKLKRWLKNVASL